VYSNVVLKNIADTFDTGSLRGSSAGCIFERLCLEGMPLNGKSFTLLSLSQPNAQMSITIPSPIQKFSRNKTTSGVKLSAETLYHPSAQNFESGDAFYQDHSGALFVFQITVAQTHPVKAAGLDRICGLFNGVKNCHLVFVTPNNGRLNSQQSITTTSSEAIQRASSSVRKFESHQWKLEYAFSVTSFSSTLHTQQEKRTRSGQSSVVVEEVEEDSSTEPLPSRSRKKKQRTE
jgi:hypothetical protein